MLKYVATLLLYFSLCGNLFAQITPALPTLKKLYTPQENSTNQNTTTQSTNQQSNSIQIKSYTQPKISVLGSVKKPGDYPYNPSESLIDVLANAGGPKRFANTNSIRITHADGRSSEFNLELYSTYPDREKLPALYAGDSIYVPEKGVSQTKSWLSSPSNHSVQLFGAVARPGRYDWTSELTLLDLLSNAGGPVTGADLSHIKITPISKGIKQHPYLFNLEQFISQGGSFEQLPQLQPGFVISVPTLMMGTDVKSLWQQQPSTQSIYVFGEVNAPGRYGFNTTMGFLDLLSAANGPTANADINDIRIIHHDALRPEISKVDLGLFFKTGDVTLLPNLVPQDAVFVPGVQGGIWAARESRERVKILGAIGRPDSYPFSDDMNIVDLLVQAGGPTTDAMLEHIIVIHPGTTDRPTVNFDLIDFAKTGNPNMLPLVRTGDIIYIPYNNQGYWRRFMDKVQDVSAVLVILAVTGVIHNGTGI